MALQRNTVDVLPSKRLPQPLGMFLLLPPKILTCKAPQFEFNTQELSLRGKRGGGTQTVGDEWAPKGKMVIKVALESVAGLLS